jgi:hypothetical protein
MHEAVTSAAWFHPERVINGYFGITRPQLAFARAMQAGRLLADQVVILVFPGGNALLQPPGRPASPAPRLRGITRIAVLRLDFDSRAAPGLVRGDEFGRINAKQLGLLDEFLPELIAEFVPFGIELVLDRLGKFRELLEGKFLEP